MTNATSEEAHREPLQAAGAPADLPSPSGVQATTGVGASAPFVYTLGRIEPRFPSISVEKEFAQATGRAQTTGLTDPETVHAVLREHRYLARQLCWVFTVQGLDTYLLVAGDPTDLDLLIDAIRPSPRPTDIDIVIGARGGLAPPEMCNGLMVPIVVIDQIYSFDADSFIHEIPRPGKTSTEKFKATAEEIFWRIMQLCDNAGATDEHRALNYLSVRYPAIYAQTATMHSRDFSLAGVEVQRSALSGTRAIVDVIFSYTHRKTDVAEPYYVQVDVTEEFPFLVGKMSLYLSR